MTLLIKQKQKKKKANEALFRKRSFTAQKQSDALNDCIWTNDLAFGLFIYLVSCPGETRKRRGRGGEKVNVRLSEDRRQKRKMHELLEKKPFVVHPKGKPS